MLEIPRRKLLGMTMAVFGFFTTQSRITDDAALQPTLNLELGEALTIPVTKVTFLPSSVPQLLFYLARPVFLSSSVPQFFERAFGALNAAKRP
jgi:hypothetical protein